MWTFPLLISPHDNKTVYVTSQHVLKTTNDGQTWEVISPDLTRNEPEKQGPSGGPITKDNTAVEYYATIFAACESPYEEGLLWAASDDGMIHVSTNRGENWKNVTPQNAPKYLMWNSIEPDPFIKGGLYAAGTLYKTGDYRPYLFKTKPFRHQEEILDLSWKRKYYALFMEMGLGKSKVIIDTLNKIKPPFNVNKAALFAASAAIKDSAWLNKEIKHVNNWNKKMFNEFKKMKIETNKSYSNFLLVNFDKVKINSSRVFKLLAKAGILVRKMDVYGIKNSLRITIGKSDENRKLIFKLKKILNVK